MLKDKLSKSEWAGLLLSFVFLASLSFAASITYIQDGSPILTNGSSGSPASNLNSDDGVYYAITAAIVPGNVAQMLLNGNFFSNDVGWARSTSGVMTINWINTGRTGGSDEFVTYGRNKAGVGSISQNFVASIIPASGTLGWCYRVTVWNVPGTPNQLDVYLNPPGGTAPGTLIDSISLTGLTGWNCRNVVIPSALINSVGTYGFTFQATLDTANNANAQVTVQVDDFELNFTTSNQYVLNVTHASTATVSVPANHTLQNVTAKLNLKSNSTSPIYSLQWLYNGAYTSSGCSASSSIPSTDTDILCSAISNPLLAISGNAIRIRLSTTYSSSSFLTSEDFIQYIIRFPNMTSSAISPSLTQSVYDNTTIQINCSATADSDYAVTGASYNLQWRNVSAGPTFSNIDTNSANGLYLAASTPTNPYVGVTIPLGGSNTQTWNVVANLEGNYELRCFPTSTTGGNQLSSALPVTVTKKTYNFTVAPSLDSFSVQNDTYIDRTYTLTNTGNQPLSITCSDNATWVSNITACPSSFAVGTSVNVTFRFNATGRPAAIESVLLSFTDPHVAKTATATVTITAAPAYNFIVSPSLDSFSVQNDSYLDRNYTLTNTGNQPLSITCSDNATWVSNITACPSSFGVGSSVNVTFRFNATGRPEANESVLLTFTDPHVSKTAIANVSITALKTYNFTVTPSLDSFSVQNDSYIDRNYTLTNTGNQPLSITCSDNATWVSNITACPSSFAVGTSVNVTFRFNATGRPVGMEYVLINFTDVHVSRNATVSVNITETDTVPPVINSVYDAPDPVSQNGTIAISANVTDNFGVSSVRVGINGTIYSMVPGASNMWYYNYTASLPLGTYTYTVYANDTSNNNATPVSGNFTVSLVIYPTVTTDLPSYTMCSAVYYKVSVFDELDQPLNASITNSLISPSNQYVFLINTFTGNGGTGVYLGMFYIGANYSTTGMWDLESLSGHVKGQTTFSIQS